MYCQCSMGLQTQAQIWTGAALPVAYCYQSNTHHMSSAEQAWRHDSYFKELFINPKRQEKENILLIEITGYCLLNSGGCCTMSILVYIRQDCFCSGQGLWAPPASSSFHCVALPPGMEHHGRKGLREPAVRERGGGLELPMQCRKRRAAALHWYLL